MHSPLKHYVYVSDTKVDMYFAQIPSPVLARIATELTLDLKILGLGVSAALKKEQTQETRYSRLKVVVKYMEENMSADIGWVDDPRAFFTGTLPMYWGLFPTRDKTKVVYFGGSTGQTLLGLGGSAYHVIGETGDATIGEPTSNLPSLVAILGEELQLHPNLPSQENFFDEDEALNAIKVMTRQMRGTAQNLEFLAKKLIYDPKSLAHGRIRPRQKHVLFGTPIYVALVD
jgi:hypothetical protein